MPDCDNYSVPARTDKVKTGPSPDRDLHYKVATTSKGRVSALVCKCYGEKPPIKSNQGVAEELARISDPVLGSDRGCPCEDCENHGKSTDDHPDLYYKRGTHKRTDRPVRSCKAYGSRFLIGLVAPRIHPQHHHQASTAHGFYVRHAKYQTVTGRENAKAEAKMRLKAYQDALPEEQRREAALLMMMHNIESATAYGKWQDR